MSIHDRYAEQVIAARDHDLAEAHRRICPNGNGTCPDADGTASNAPESHGDAPRSVLGANAGSDKGEDAKAAQDTREKLEADLERLVEYWRGYDGNYMRVYSTVAYAQVKELLDRQAAITERETIERNSQNWHDWCADWKDPQQRTATERLREMLDERGVAHSDHYLSTTWRDGHGILHLAGEPMADGSLVVDMLTPEQAIAATLGSEREKQLELLVNQLWYLVNHRSGYGYAAALEAIEELGIEVDE